mmetsp:Transcript_7072/g.15468  ORF Transcript_7072/g.15468 Transcript_7072/m.15468 type:complete len:238 (+) Transcript_7072:1164-1877(+)
MQFVQELFCCAERLLALFQQGLQSRDALFQVCLGEGGHLKRQGIRSPLRLFCLGLDGANEDAHALLDASLALRPALLHNFLPLVSLFPLLPLSGTAVSCSSFGDNLIASDADGSPEELEVFLCNACSARRRQLPKYSRKVLLRHVEVELAFRVQANFSHVQIAVAVLVVLREEARLLLGPFRGSHLPRNLLLAALGQLQRLSGPPGGILHAGLAGRQGGEGLLSQCFRLFDRSSLPD